VADEDSNQNAASRSSSLGVLAVAALGFRRRRQEAGYFGIVVAFVYSILAATS